VGVQLTVAVNEVGFRGGDAAPDVPELHLEAYLPADEHTARILRDRRRRPGGEIMDTFPRELVVGT
jgi:hypothetical protein